jgi:hypothetical protein
LLLFLETEHPSRDCNFPAGATASFSTTQGTFSDLSKLQMTRTRSPTHRVQVFVWVLLIIGLVLFNLFEPPALDALSSESPARWFHSLFIGVLIAECGILSSGLVLCNQPLWLRLCVHWTVAALLSGAWWLGGAIAEDRWSCNYLVTHEFRWEVMLLCLPLICLASQTPLAGPATFQMANRK